jgi:lactate dehydrogenase-like 2-hydroxyacid dehydrogenase
MSQLAVLEYFDCERLDALLGDDARALPAEECDVAEVVGLISGGGIVVDADLLASYPRTRVVVTGSTGYDHMELDDLRRAGVAGYCTPGYCSREVADFALACALAGLRGVVGLDRAMQSGVWEEHAAGTTHRIRGSVLGVIGLGKIGGLVARDAAALGMRVLASDPVASDEAFAGPAPSATSCPLCWRPATSSRCTPRTCAGPIRCSGARRWRCSSPAPFSSTPPAPSCSTSRS